jgi:hypothetical protein
MNVLHQIVDLVNQTIEANIQLGDRAVYHCLAELIEKDGKEFPVIKSNTDSTPLAPNTNYHLVLYHRVTEGPETEVIEGFGDDDDSEFTFTLKTVGFFRSTAFGSVPYTSRDAAIRVMDCLPASLKFTGDYVQRLRIEKAGGVQLDNEIWDEEFPQIDRKKANSLKLAAFSFNSTITGRLCGGACLDGETISVVGSCEDAPVDITQSFTFGEDNAGEAYLPNIAFGGTIKAINDKFGWLMKDEKVSTDAAYATAGEFRCLLEAGNAAAVGKDAYINTTTHEVTTASGAGYQYIGWFNSAALTNPSGLPAGSYADVIVNQTEA